MDLWTFRRYQQPRLQVDAIKCDRETATVSLVSGGQQYRLAFDNATAAEHIASTLDSLRQREAPMWSSLREIAADSAWDVLATFLDTRSLIADDGISAVDELARQRARIEACVASTVTAVRSDTPIERWAAAARTAAALRAHLFRPEVSSAVLDPGRDVLDAAIQPNFYLALLELELEYFRRASPLTLAAADRLFALVAGAPGVAPEAERIFGDSAGVYDERDLASHLWLVAHCLVASTSDSAARFPTARIPTDLQVASGLEFMRRTELLSRDTLTRWGENPYITAINRLEGAYSPLIAGPFIEQYHVTSRFVEIIAPLLSKRLVRGLRSQTFRYYSEEYGHEALESTTCEALGVAASTLEKTVPLPLHFAFVDVLTLFAAIDPITSFASVMAIEGIFGEPPKMSLRLVAAARQNEAFRKVSGDHDELNGDLNHNSISRNLFQHVKALSPERQMSAMRRILFLLEVNHRAWEGIAGFYGRQHHLRVQGAFGQLIPPGEHES
jgi:hypothetical protein